MRPAGGRCEDAGAPWSSCVRSAARRTRTARRFPGGRHSGRKPVCRLLDQTSAVVGDDERLVGTGLLYFMTFRSDLTHSVSVSNDAEGLVCGETSCEWNGSYSYTRTTLTTIEPNHPDPDERGEDSSSYVFCGGRLIFMDSDGDFGLRLTFKRTGPGR